MKYRLALIFNAQDDADARACADKLIAGACSAQAVFVEQVKLQGIQDGQDARPIKNWPK